MPFLGFGYPCQAIFLLGNDEDMNWSCRSNVSEGKYLLIFVDDICRNLLSDKFVENGLFSHLRYVYIGVKGNRFKNLPILFTE